MGGALLWAGLLFPVAGQSIAEPGDERAKIASERFEQMWGVPENPRIACEVVKYGPALGYGLKTWAGYTVFLPVIQFDATKPHRVAVFLKVAAEDPPGKPVAGQNGRITMFWQRQDLPVPPAEQRNIKNAGWTIGGGFYLGPGEYSVRWILLDETGRRAKKSWRISVKGGKTAAATPPGVVESLDSEMWKGFGENKGLPKALVMIHAAPTWPRRYVSRLSPWDRQVLIGSLTSVLREARFGGATVVVFDLDRRRVLFRDDSFGPGSLRRLNEQLAQANYATIPYKTLTEGPAVNEYLEQLLREEIQAAGKPDMLIFAGPYWRLARSAPKAPADLRESVPRPYFVGFGPPNIVPQDPVTVLVKSLKGRVLAVHRPEDLPRAIKIIAEHN